MESQTLLAKALLLAFPDRVAKIRSKDTSETRNRFGKFRELVLSSGGTALAGDNALTRSHETFVVVEAQEVAQGKETSVKARSLCPIEEDWLLDFFPDELKEEQTFAWNAKSQRVEGFKRLKYGQLVLDEKPLSPGDFGPEAASLLLKQALSAGPQAYCDPQELSDFLNRVKFVSERSPLSPPLKKGGEGGISRSPSPLKGVGLRPGVHRGESPYGRQEGNMGDFPHERERGDEGGAKAPGEGGFSDAMIQETLMELCQGCRGLEDLRSAGFVSALRARLTPKDQSLLEKLAPAQVTLASGRKLVVHYESGKAPWGESRLQDFFGMKKGPTVAGGEVPVTLHLLSPRKQPVQVTSDLGGFWEKHYPQIRKELSRKYPRHKWPENPLNVSPS